MPEPTPQETFERESKRRSLDTLMVHNFLKEPFTTIYDQYKYIVRAGEDRPLPRYLAKKFMEEIITHKINQDEKKAVDKENKKRKDQGHPVMTADERQTFANTNKLRTNDPERRKEYMKMVYKGVTEEYGMELPEAEEPKKADRRTIDDQLLEELDKEMGTELPEPKEDLEEKKKALEKEISE